jgi:hypothetical protein
MLDKILQVIPYVQKATSKFIPAIKVEIEQLYYSLTVNDCPSFIIIDIHPSKYWMDVLLTNTSNTDVYLKSIKLIINEEEYGPTEEVAGFRLEAGQLIKKTYIFSVPQNVAVKEGEYELITMPATGKATSTKGKYPIKK